MKKVLIPILLLWCSAYLHSQSGWTLYVTGSSYASSVFFFDSQTGWICEHAAFGRVYKSINGGSNWFLASENIGMNAHSISFRTPDIGTVVAGPYNQANYPIWNTDNGGIYFWSIAYPSYSAADFTSIANVNGTFWTCGLLTDWTYVTQSFISDGPNTYFLGHAIPLNRMRFCATEVWTVGNSGIIYRSNIYVGSIDPSANFTGVSFPTTNTGYVVGGGYFFKTTDHGTSWMRLHPQTPEGTYNDVYFTNNETGWIAASGAVLYTTSGGTSWTQQWSGAGSGSEIRFFNNLTGWILWGNDILKTTSGGISTPPPLPVLVSPSNGSTINTTTPLLDWDNVPTANTYQVQISTDTVLRIIVLDTNGIVNSNLTVPAGRLLPGALYYWRVRGNNGVYGPWSSYWHFTVAPVPPAPVLVSPPNNSTGNPLGVTLTWNASSGATSYRVQMAYDSLFTNILINDSTLTGTSKAVSGLSILTRYYWRVNAKGPTGTGPWSPVWNFKTMGTPTQVTLLQPPNNSINVPTSYTFKWSKAYDQTVHLFVSNYWFERVTDTISMANLLRDTTLTDTTKAVTGMSTNTSYYWRVKAKNQIGWGNFAPWFKFTTVVAAPNAPTLISPINGAVGQSLTPKLDWSVSPTAASYRVQVSLDSIFGSTVLDSVTSRDSLIVPTGRLVNNTRYYWRVNAANAGGTSPWSTTWHFNTLLIGAGNLANEIPKEFNLYTNYPNPFNPSTVIKLDIPQEAYVRLVIYDLTGQEVEVLVNEQIKPGTYQIQFNGSNYPSGVYFYKLETEKFTQTRKMVLLK